MSDPSDDVVVEPVKKHRLRDLAGRLYQGDAGLDIVGKRKIFYGLAAGILLVGILTILVRPFHVGIVSWGTGVPTVEGSADGDGSRLSSGEIDGSGASVGALGQPVCSGSKMQSAVRASRRS